MSRPSTEEAMAAVGIARVQHAEATRQQPESRPRTRLFRGVIEGRDVLVTIHDPEGYGEVAFRDGEGRWARWGVPVELHEEA